jgi:hypothetical protein
MSQQLGYVVLRAVAEQYRAYPESWTTGNGTLADRTFKSFKGDIRPGETGCIHTMIEHFGRCYGSLSAIKQAITVLCAHHGLENCPSSIWKYNDHRAGCVENIIAFVEAPLVAVKDAPGFADFDSLPPMPEPRAGRKRAVAAAVCALCISAIGMTLPFPL